MDTLTYEPPLRGAVKFLFGIDRGAVSTDLIAEMAQTTPSRSAAYASILIANHVLRETRLGLVRGRGWEAWNGKPARSRPRESACAHGIEVDGMRRSIAIRVQQELAARNWSMRELARRAGIRHQFLVLLRRRHRTPPACQLILLARALGTTVESLVTVPASPAEMRG